MAVDVAKGVETPGRYLEKLPAGSYVHVERLPGTPSAAKSAASRAAARGELVPLRRGLYYKGKRTRYGVATPSPEEVALEVLGREGVGPTGVSAARALNLTTQVPAVPELVTSGPVPTGIKGVRVHKRNNVARRHLNYVEIALLEVLRDWKFTTESSWDGVVAAVGAQVKARQVRPEMLLAAARGERKPEVKAAMRGLVGALSWQGTPTAARTSTTRADTTATSTSTTRRAAAAR
jgi:hypothetical protein